MLCMRVMPWGFIVLDMEVRSDADGQRGVIRREKRFSLLSPVSVVPEIIGSSRLSRFYSALKQPIIFSSCWY